MKILREILQDRMVNSFIVGLVLGFGTINFVNNIGGMILDHIFRVATSVWNWKIFYGQLILYGMAIIIAMSIRRRVIK